MPISSGALGWPNSYFQKPEEDDLQHQQEGDISRINGRTQDGLVWTLQLTDRSDYEAWKEQFEPKETKRLSKERKEREKRRKEERAKLKRETARNDVEQVLANQRRRRCFLLSLCVLLVLLALFFGCLVAYVNLLDEDDLGPPVTFDAECQGQWRTHFLGYSVTLANGSVFYVCCYLPDVNASYRFDTLSKGTMWPSGYVIPKAACPTNHGKCDYFEKNNLFDPGTPPCSTGSHAAVVSLLLLLIVVTCYLPSL